MPEFKFITWLGMHVVGKFIIINLFGFGNTFGFGNMCEHLNISDNYLGSINAEYIFFNNFSTSKKNN